VGCTGQGALTGLCPVVWTSRAVTVRWTMVEGRLKGWTTIAYFVFEMCRKINYFSGLMVGWLVVVFFAFEQDGGLQSLSFVQSIVAGWLDGRYPACS